MKKPNHSRAFLMRAFATTAFCSLLIPHVAIAQEAADEEAVLEQVIVIGTAGGKGINRLDASFAVTTFDGDDLEKLQPTSTADLLRSVPGIWSESSGGVAGANIDVRGLPGGGDAPFVSFAVNGSPLFGTNTLSFFEGSTLFRIDETVESVEALRGGPNAVFAKGEPGATINFRLKEGGEDTMGRVKYSTSDYDLQRFDGFVSGKLADDLYYMVGGYISRSPGVRDAQFTSEEGQQFTAQVTKIFDNGRINLYTRVTDDHGQWYLPINLNNPNIDTGTFSQLGNPTRLREITVNTNGDTQVFDFADGRGWDGQVTGANIEFDLGNGFTLRDNVNFVSGDANTLGFVPSGSAVQASALSAVIGGPVTTLGGQVLGAGDQVQTYGHWVVLKELNSFSNDLSLSKTFGEVHDVTVGIYTSTFSSDDWWSIGNPVPVHNAQNGDLLDPSITPADIAAAGGDGGFNFGLASAGDARVTAFYIADSWQVTDRLRVDLGVRQENIEIDYTLDTGPGFPDGTRDLATSIEADEIAYTAAANYDVSDNFSVFVRYSDGFRFPGFDNIREGQTQVNAVEQLEGGVKYRGDWLSVFATAYYNTNDSFSSDVGSVVSSAAFETEATGIELDGVIEYGAFQMGFGATLQNAEITASTTATDVGNTVLRQPDVQLRITPQYTLDFANGMSATLYGTAAYVGDRFGDNGNTVDLPSYEKIDLGVIVNTDSGLFFQIHGDNITDSDGITEGDPRNPTAPNGRPIFGSSVKFTVGYDF